jgi:hypothetical protein
MLEGCDGYVGGIFRFFIFFGSNFIYKLFSSELGFILYEFPKFKGFSEFITNSNIKLKLLRVPKCVTSREAYRWV